MSEKETPKASVQDVEESENDNDVVRVKEDQQACSAKLISGKGSVLVEVNKNISECASAKGSDM